MRSQFLQSPRISTFGRRGGEPQAAFPATVTFDPVDLSSMFQDAGGTTPVTADGDPVGRMADLAAGTAPATQSTAAARPLYKTDGTYHWIEADGTDDYLDLPWFQNVGASQSFCIGFTMEAAGDSPYLFGGSDTDAGVASYGVGTTRDNRLVVATASGAVSYGASDFTAELGTEYVLTVTWDRATGSLRQYRDGVEVYSGTTPAEDLTPTTLHSLFRGNGSTARCWAGKIFGFVGYSDGDVWTADERAKAEAWIAARTGTSPSALHLMSGATFELMSGLPFEPME